LGVKKQKRTAFAMPWPESPIPWRTKKEQEEGREARRECDGLKTEVVN